MADFPSIPQPPAPSPTPPNYESQARTWNMLCHLSSLSGYVGIPFGNILGPLLIWQLKKNEFPSVEKHGKDALNFQITFTLALLILFVGVFILLFLCVGWFLLPVFFVAPVAGFIVSIIAAIKASNGEDYKYPFTIDFIK